MGAALNSLLDETKADGTYKRIFDEVASNTTETLGCAPQVRFLTPEAHNLMHPIPKIPFPAVPLCPLSRALASVPGLMGWAHLPTTPFLPPSPPLLSRPSPLGHAL